VALSIREDKPAPLTQAPPRLSRVIRSRRLWYYAVLALILQAIVISTSLAFTASYLKQFTDSDLMLGVSASVFIGCSALSGLAVGHIRRVGSHTLLMLLFGLLLAYCVLMPLCREVWQIVALQGLSGLGSGAGMSALMALAMQGTDVRARSTAMGFFQAMFGVGMTLGPVLMGALIQWSQGYHLGYWTLGAFAFIGIAAFRFPPKPAADTLAPECALPKAP
jgi:MFS family permease